MTSKLCKISDREMITNTTQTFMYHTLKGIYKVP